MRTVSQQRRRFTGVVALLVLVTSSRAHLSASNAVAPVPEPYASEILATTPSSPWTPEMAALGKRLFFEPRLSRDCSVSCATCHDPKRAFTDGIAARVASAGRLGPRNTPTILNRGVGRLEFWDGRAATLEDQALGPIEAEGEMDLTIEEAVARLRQEPSYREVFPGRLRRRPSAERLAQAIAAYERTVYSIDSAFDRFLAGDRTPFLPTRSAAWCCSAPRPAAASATWDRTSATSSSTPSGWHRPRARRRHEGGVRDGAFKTPTLREITSTAPYMHDGSIADPRRRRGVLRPWRDAASQPQPEDDSARPHRSRKASTSWPSSAPFSGTIVEVPGIHRNPGGLLPMKPIFFAVVLLAASAAQAGTITGRVPVTSAAEADRTVVYVESARRRPPPRPPRAKLPAEGRPLQPDGASRS